MKKSLKISLLIILALLLVVAVGFIAWASFPLGPGTTAMSALKSDSTVNIEENADWVVFRPAAQQTRTGFIYYPGGRVDYRSYAHLLRPLAEQGYLVVLVRMPLSLAVFSPAKAAEVIQSLPEITDWVIGGHSLGGAMAANFVFNNPGKVKGLVLWASYPAESNSLAAAEVEVVSIYGSEDGEVDTIESSGSLLPGSTGWVRIEGGNHAQFGDYGEQPGDGDASISASAQWEQVIAATDEFLDMITIP